MILTLATRYRKEVAFFISYSFTLSGLCSFVYGRSEPEAIRPHTSTGAHYYPHRVSKNNVTGKPAVILPYKAPTVLNVPAAETPGHPEPTRHTDIGGPSQPEMTAFRPVGSDNMVDPFTGDFSYNIPLLDVGGYPVNIFYNSGITMDQEASWVGLGWNINPGTISRNMRGLPDDFDGTEIIAKEQYSRPDRTWGVNVGGNMEFFGGAANLGINGGIFYNNIRGLGLEAGVRPSVNIGGKAADKKTASLTVAWKLSGNSQSGGSSTFSISVNDNNKKGLDGSLTASVGIHSRQGMQALHLDGEFTNSYKFDKTQSSIARGEAEINPTFGTQINFAYPSFMPAMRSRITSENYDIDLGMGTALSPAFPHLRLGGYYSMQRIRREDIRIEQPAFGMLYLKQGQQNSNALMDFNRLNDGGYTRSTPAIAVPVYTYDVYSISGEGTGGSFRAYRGDLGYMKDATVETNGMSGHLGFEVGGGSYGHGALNIRTVLTPSKSGEWISGNLARNSFGFIESNKDTQAVYFKNPGEKAIPAVAYQEAIGGEDLVRLKMIVNAPGSPSTVPSFVRYTDMLQKKADLPVNAAATIKQRDKRTQVISFLTAYEADRAGLNRRISYVEYSAALDTTKVVFGCSNNGRKTMRRYDAELPVASRARQKHHVSEIDVLMPDGRRYVYDVPVYNLGQKDVTFNLTGNGNGTAPNDHLSNYIPGTDNEAEVNQRGKDYFVEKQLTPPYAHSYLLSALLSPNYVDVKGDGITDDDMGDAIKFNYLKCPDPLKWRTPADASKANLSEGLKTDKNDDKGHYIYGEREQWYLYSIESKNMVARFYVKADRKDSRGVLGEEGGIDPNYGAYKLYKISLFTKGELLKRPINPRPVKTVHFKYDYSLCPNVSHNNGQAETENGVNINSAKGKLTLKEIYFTYNGNSRGKRNVYRFYYPEGSGNPAFVYTANDRWGNYKPENAISGASTNGNPDGLRNADFPYTPVDASKANENCRAWTMNKVQLPSGAMIEVEYEADDYAYVQDRRASYMFAISGFGSSPQPSSYSDKLYENKNLNYEYIYVTVPRAISATTPVSIRNQIQEWYLGNYTKDKQTYMKLAVNMPSDKNGSGYEMIPVYAVVTDFGLINNTGGQKIWLKVQSLLSGYSPMVHYSLQFLKSALPSKAYPGYDVSDEGGLRSVVKAMGGLFHSFKEVFNGGMKLMMDEGKCKTTVLSKSFIRLTDPYLKRPGGGLRVKKVVINDNWDKMTKTSPTANDGLLNATYGQEYFYTKKELINGELMTISSGVASWEPAMGAEENPHRQALEFHNKTPKADYDYSVMETPVPEMLYPSASVGYSRVETRSIHRDTVKNAPGIAVSEFYTTREFPTTSSFTPLSEYNATDYYESGALDRFLKADLKTAVALSQGFKVDLNDMNGKLKKQSAYSPDNLNDPISYTENFYSMQRTGGNSFRLNHNFPVIGGPDGVVQNGVIGREVELMTDFREHSQQTITTNIDFNLDVISGAFIPIPIPTTWKPVVRESNIYRSAAMLKVVNHFSVLDSVVAVDKGSMVSTKNLVYDAETGDPLLTRTNNEHNQPIYSFTYPAHWAYSGMGLAYKNIDVIFKNVTFRNGKIDASPNVNLALFESGDEILVNAGEKGWQAVSGDGVCEPAAIISTPAIRIWAVNTGKAGSATPQWVFMDANGNPFTAGGVNIRIIRSGKRNMFGAGLGGVTSLVNPVNPSTNKLEFNDAKNIVQTAAVTFKDHWRVDDALYVFDTLVSQTRWAPVHETQVYRRHTYSVGMYKYSCNSCGYASTHFSEPPYLLSRNQSFGIASRFSKKKQKSWVSFDLTNSPLLNSGVTVLSARLNLFSHSSTAGISHWFYYNNPQGNSNTLGHNSHNPHYYSLSAGNNNFKINRMLGIWPQVNAATWHQDHFNGYEISTPENEVFVPGTQPFSVSSKDYTSFGPVDNSIEFTTIFKAMIRDSLDITKQYSPAIKLSMAYGGDQEQDAHVCFYTILDKWDKRPLINVKYYSCAEAYPLGYVPYPGEQVVKCTDTTVYQSFCRSKFTARKSINPYVEGIWGNWRADTSFVYYGDRAENTVTGEPVDIRKGGTITGYKSFWNFAALSTGMLSRNFTANDVWVWNSTITQYNRKGYEVENKDPLGRFNAGLYGYNQQLPVAVINNSRYMESMFDGFEDYDYQSNSCTEMCTPRRRVNMGNIQNFLNGEQKHTGKQSLKLNAGQTFTFSAPVLNEQSLDKPYSMRVKMDSASYNGVNVLPNGNGLLGKYKEFSKQGHTWQYYANQTIASIAAGNFQDSLTSSQVNFGTAPGQQTPVTGWGSFAARWNGYLLPRETGIHKFQIVYNDGMVLRINGTALVLDGWNQAGSGSRTGQIQLTKGVPVTIEVDFWDGNPTGSATMLWQEPGRSSYEVIPQAALYTPNNYAGAQAAVTTVSGWCTKLDSVNVRGNALNDTFSLIQNRKMVISAWVRVGGNDCKCSTYVNNKIRITYTGSTEEKEFTPAGSIIEGWQRYEGVFIIPSAASKINIELVNSSGSSAWFDDLRLLPFNANMKSFVYNPQNLRLMSELDENNYASFYEYDDEGTLTRVKKETIKGVKTITETRSHLQKAD